MSELFSNITRIEIQFGDCDPAGIVYYPNYFRFFDNATAALLSAALGMNKREWVAEYDIAGIPMVDTGARFLMPLRFGDVAELHSQIGDLGRSSFSVSHRLSHGTDLVAEGNEKRVWVIRNAAGGISAAPLPDQVRKALGG
jgi:4-hydroxybenzoyl-CoA thioesterase